jgi:DNA-binding NarL/FixJ family response regulator
MGLSGNGRPTEDILRLLIVDDQPLIRRGLSMILSAEPGIQVVGQAEDGLDAIDQAMALKPDVILMDLQMPKASGVVATREITAALPDTKVVVLTTYDDDDLVFEAIRAGAHAYLLKDASEAEVLETIRSAQRGESRLSPSIARKVMQQFRALSPNEAEIKKGAEAPAAADCQAHPSIGATPDAAGLQGAAEEPLSQKEVRILDLLSQGMSNKQIAAAVFLAEGTVKNYLTRIMDKLHAVNRLELAVRALAQRNRRS